MRGRGRGSCVPYARWLRGVKSLLLFSALDAPFVVAVSGGPDSMALAWLLHQHGPIKAVTVDHGLRRESGEEAAQVGRWLAAWGAEHYILKTDEPPPKTRVQEWARALRYRLMARFCAKHGAQYLVLAHHADDQAETLVFRLAKGSGLDGLAGMHPKQKFENIMLVRPLLDVSKADLLALCEKERIPFVCDPSNHAPRFARVRVRHALEAEGATRKRLAKTAARLARAQEALEIWTDKAWQERAEKRDNMILLSLTDLPLEIVLRLLDRACACLAPHSPYGPELQKLEIVAQDFIDLCTPFRRRTLGGVVFTKQPDGRIKLSPEGQRGTHTPRNGAQNV